MYSLRRKRIRDMPVIMIMMKLLMRKAFFKIFLNLI